MNVTNTTSALQARLPAVRFGVLAISRVSRQSSTWRRWFRSSSWEHRESPQRAFGTTQCSHTLSSIVCPTPTFTTTSRLKGTTTISSWARNGPDTSYATWGASMLLSKEEMVMAMVPAPLPVPALEMIAAPRTTTLASTGARMARRQLCRREAKRSLILGLLSTLLHAPKRVCLGTHHRYVEVLGPMMFLAILKFGTVSLPWRLEREHRENTFCRCLDIRPKLCQL